MELETQLKIAFDEIEQLNATLGRYVSAAKVFEERIEFLKAAKETLEHENNRLELLLTTAQSDVAKYKLLLANPPSSLVGRPA
jgi:prefoldin subunit 5